MFKTLVMIIRIWLLLVISWQIWAVPKENDFALKRQVGDFCVGRTAPVIGNRSVIQAPCLLCGHWTLDSGEQITLFRIFVLLRQALYKPLTTQYLLWCQIIKVDFEHFPFDKTVAHIMKCNTYNVYGALLEHWTYTSSWLHVYILHWITCIT